MPLEAPETGLLERGPRDGHPRRPWRQRLIFLLRLILTAAVLALLLHVIRPATVAEALRGADLRFLLILLAIRPFIFLVRGWRFWHLTAAVTGRPLPMTGTLGWHFVSLNLGVFTPSGVGELSAAYFMKRHGVDASETVTAMALDKIITVAMIGTMGLVGASLYLEIDRRWWLALVGALATLAAGSWLLRRLLGRLEKLVGQRWRKAREALLRALDFISAHPGALGLNVAAAVLQSLLFTLQIWLCFRMFQTEVSFFGIFWLTGLGRLVNLLPVTFGGLGVYEGSMVLLLEQLGAERGVAFAAVLIPRMLTWLIAGAVVCVTLWWKPKRPAAS